MRLIISQKNCEGTLRFISSRKGYNLHQNFALHGVVPGVTRQDKYPHGMFNKVTSWQATVLHNNIIKFKIIEW
jgi:hypothetical protein